MVGNWEISAIGVQGGVTNSLAKVKRIKILRKFQRKKVSKYCSTHFNIKVCITQKHTDLFLVAGLLLISQYVKIGYINLWAKIKVREV